MKRPVSHFPPSVEDLGSCCCACAYAWHQSGSHVGSGGSSAGPGVAGCRAGNVDSMASLDPRGEGFAAAVEEFSGTGNGNSPCAGIGACRMWGRTSGPGCRVPPCRRRRRMRRPKRWPNWERQVGELPIEFDRLGSSLHPSSRGAGLTCISAVAAAPRDPFAEPARTVSAVDLHEAPHPGRLALRLHRGTIRRPA